MEKAVFKVGPDIMEQRYIDIKPAVGEFIVIGNGWYEVVSITHIYHHAQPYMINVGMRPASMEASHDMDVKQEGPF